MVDGGSGGAARTTVPVPVNTARPWVRFPGPSLLVYLLLVGLHVAAAVAPSPWSWGIHQLSFLPLGVRLAFGAAFLLLLVPAIATAVAVLPTAVARVAGSFGVTVLFAAASAVAFWLGRIEFAFLGDGLVWIQHLESGAPFYFSEPLATTVLCWTARALNASQPGTVAGATSVLLGFVFIVAALRVCRSRWTDVYTRGLAATLLLLHPTILLFFGYVESYAMVQVLSLLFVWSLLRAPRGFSLVVPATILGVAIATHLVAVFWLPALWANAWRPLAGAHARVAPGREPQGAPHGATLGPLVAMLLAFAIAAAITFAVGSSPGSVLKRAIGPQGIGAQESTWFWSAPHAADVSNLIVLVLGPAFVLAAHGLARRAQIRELWADPAWRPLVLLVAGSLSFAVLVQPRIGGARDWDLFASWSVPAVLLGVELSRRLRQKSLSPSGETKVAGRAVGLAVLVTSSWLWVNLDPALAARRFIVLQQQGGPFSRDARGYASETLGVYYRSRDPRLARDSWREATLLAPSHARYHVNLGSAALALGDLNEARVAWARAHELGERDARIVYNLALACLRTGHAAEAVRHFDELIAGGAGNWSILQSRARAKTELGLWREALVDLDRALQLDSTQADVHCDRGVALRSLGDSAGARGSFRAALRLAPAHPEARRALESMSP